jgi:hypothetical protein
MAYAVGLLKQVAFKVESAFGIAPGQATAQLLRRVKSTINLNKETYASNELRTDFQIADFRHGVRSVVGALSGELSPGTYSAIMGVALKRDFAAVTAITGASLTIAGAGPTHTVTRAAGSWFTDGFKNGMVVRLSVGTLNAANLSKNLLILDITSATAMTVQPLNGVVMVAEGPITGCTVTATGKSTYIPTTGHTDKSMSIEHWFSDVTVSELYLGCKIDKISLTLPPTGIATVDFDIMGQDVADVTTKRGSVALNTQYFTTPTAITTSAPLAAVNGLIRAGGVTLASVTGLSISIDPAYSGEAVVGSNIKPALFAGTVSVTGTMTVFFENSTLRDAFFAETELELMAAFTTDNTATADFISMVIPRLKLGGASKDDTMTGLKATIPFQALLNTIGSTSVKSEKTTFLIQDSLA